MKPGRLSRPVFFLDRFSSSGSLGKTRSRSETGTLPSANRDLRFQSFLCRPSPGFSCVNPAGMFDASFSFVYMIPIGPSIKADDNNLLSGRGQQHVDTHPRHL